MRTLSIILLMFTTFAPCAFGAEASGDVLATLEHPGGAWTGTVPEPVEAQMDRSWPLRTGLRKGVFDQMLPEEVQAAPDAAVLATGLYGAWPGILAPIAEPWAFVGPGDIAGLMPRKPALVIPSGGLSGLASSAFFKAGLAEYVRSGGVVLCFSQRSGADLAALPVPETAKAAVSGRGWTEDSGPLYRASLVQTDHPVLSAVRRTAPSVETDGYLQSLPPEARVLLARSDGRATLAVYPFGKGWVAVTTLMSDYSAVRGMLQEEEASLVQSLLAWAKAGGRVRSAAPGGTIPAELRLSGPERGAAAWAGMRMQGPAPSKPFGEKTLPFTIAAGQEAALSVAGQLPQDAQPGIYRFESRLYGDNRMPLTAWGETGEGWFAVTRRIAASPAAPADQPLPAAPLAVTTTPTVTIQGGRLRLTLDIRRGPGAGGSQELLARALGQEKFFTLAADHAVVAFDADGAADGTTLVFAVYHAEGRLLVRGGIAAAQERQPVAFDKRSYLPGGEARFAVSGLGPGAFTLSALGTEIEEHISADRTFGLNVPPGLPPGTYPAAWEFRTRSGEQRNGMAPLIVEGPETRCASFRWEPAPGASVPAVLRIQAGSSFSALVRLVLSDPSGRERLQQSRTLQLAPGMNEVSVPLTLPADRAGIWEVRYEIAAVLPEGPGFPQEPMPLATGHAYVDAGNAAVLSLTTDRPVYYEARGPVTINATVFLRARTQVEITVDGKRAEREKFSTPGTASLSATVSRLTKERHRIAVSASGSGPADLREEVLLYGARLPDLTAVIQTSGMKAPALEVGIGIANNGAAASGPARAALWEGDPAKGGVLISSFAVPALEPGSQHVVVVPWPLGGKAGLRTLTAVVDGEHAVPEIDEENNSSSIALTVPDVLVSLVPDRESFAADEEISYRVSAANFTDHVLPLVTVNLHTENPAGKRIATEILPLASLRSGEVRTLDRRLGIEVPQEGVYPVSAEISDGGITASAAAVLTVRPTLSVKGSLEGTAATAGPCKPLEIRYAVRNAGNLRLAGGVLRIEIRRKATGEVVNAVQLPLVEGSASHRIDRISFPRGDYRVSLRASATARTGAAGDFVLDQRDLAVRQPLEALAAAGPVPRLLVWAGRENDSAIGRALTEKMLREAFETESVFFKVVTDADAFSREAAAGPYNAYLLFEIDSMLDAEETLRSVLSRGHGVVIAGAGERARGLAERFGFRFTAAPGGYLAFPSGSPLGLSGTMPFAGPAYAAARKDAAVLAVLSDDHPAILSAAEDKGRIMVIPFPLVRSALAAGTSLPYSLLLRAAVLTTAPAAEEGGLTTAAQFTLSAPSGPARARLSAELPAGTKLLWSNLPAAVRNSTVTFEFTAEPAGRRIVALFRSEKPGLPAPAFEAAYECDGMFVSQGKVE